MYDIMSDCPFGFTKEKSTTDAIYSLLSITVNGLDDTNDTVSHELLLRKLQCYGLRRNTNVWIRS